MEDLLKQDIFFVVTTISVIVLTGLLVILLIYVIKITKKVDYIATKAKQEADLLSGELSTLRSNIRSSGFKLSFLFNFLRNITKKRK